MFAELLKEFASSEHGQNALGALQQKFPDLDSQQIMDSAVPAAAQAMHKVTAGHAQPHVGLFNMLGGHAGRSFLAGAVAGLIRGDGIMGSLKDGVMGTLGGHVAEYLAQETGLDPQVASEVAALLTPFITHYAHDKLSTHPDIAG